MMEGNFEHTWGLGGGRRTPRVRIVSCRRSDRWFDQLYAAGASGQVQMPWSRIEPHALLTGWVQDRI
jgi:hypothetical protein